ncbi:hypothetical protein AHF37_12088 [Paragonimus kellicotti]|nr:hypothetical protein AHF37_12088 [Paragonimus kellicotti]
MPVECSNVVMSMKNMPHHTVCVRNPEFTPRLIDDTGIDIGEHRNFHLCYSNSGNEEEYDKIRFKEK